MEALREKYIHAIPTIRDNSTNCSFPREDAFHLFQDPITGYQPWPGLLIQATLGVVFYWCSDQVKSPSPNISHKSLHSTFYTYKYFGMVQIRERAILFWTSGVEIIIFRSHARHLLNCCC